MEWSRGVFRDSQSRYCVVGQALLQVGWKVEVEEGTY